MSGRQIQIALRVTDDVRQKLKILATLQNKSMSDIVRECIEDRYAKAGLPDPEELKGGGKNE